MRKWVRFMTNKQQMMIEMNTQEIIAQIIEDEHLSIDDAMKKFYTSVAFEKLSDVETGLYLEGADYLVEYFKRRKYL